MESENLDTDLLDALRDHTRSFLRLDFAYLAAGGAIITALQIGRSELMEFGADIAPAVIALGLLSLFDTALFSIVINDWLAARTRAGKRGSAKLIKSLVRVQPFVHLTFVLVLLVGAVSFASGAHIQLNTYRSYVHLQETVDMYVQANGKAPDSFSQLKSALPKTTPSGFNDQNVRIQSTGEKSYKITFAGEDGLFGTEDDEVATQDLSLRNVLDAVESDLNK